MRAEQPAALAPPYLPSLCSIGGPTRRRNTTEEGITQFIKAGVLCSAVLASAVAGLLTASSAQARGSKDFYSQDYQFDRPMRGFEGQQGSYYCSYQRLPNRVCTVDASGNERCVIKGWTLRQYCY